MRQDLGGEVQFIPMQFALSWHGLLFQPVLVFSSLETQSNEKLAKKNSTACYCKKLGGVMAILAGLLGEQL